MNRKMDSARQSGCASRGARLLHSKSPAAQDDGAHEDDLLPSKIEHETSLKRPRPQAFVEAMVVFQSAWLLLLIGADHLARAGIGLKHDLPGTVAEVLEDLRLILSGRGCIAELRQAVPAHVTAAAIAYRAERARRSGGRQAV
ncbi:MAG TPA: hypothetical protein VHG92_14820 [Afifellaceae bacterium]|nr:hypothetical protein [Afifellaceae bacterium]